MVMAVISFKQPRAPECTGSRAGTVYGVLMLNTHCFVCQGPSCQAWAGDIPAYTPSYTKRHSWLCLSVCELTWITYPG